MEDNSPDESNDFDEEITSWLLDFTSVWLWLNPFTLGTVELTCLILFFKKVVKLSDKTV